ncbi:hypothetical protein BHM03_00023917 [Ensete ventricosum]|nr:hypothetical protein BHM03_00023917 [Ensete ventricosum]
MIRCLVNKLISHSLLVEVLQNLRCEGNLVLGQKNFRECKVTAQRSLQKLWRLFLTLLAENAGLNPIVIVTEPRNRHAQGETNAGINVRKGQITNILGENVVQPLLVSTSAITLATKCVMMILKIDDIITVEVDWSICQQAASLGLL